MSNAGLNSQSYKIAGRVPALKTGKYDKTSGSDCRFKKNIELLDKSGESYLDKVCSLKDRIVLLENLDF